MVCEYSYCVSVEPDDQLNPKKKIFEQIQVSKYITAAASLERAHVHNRAIAIGLRSWELGSISNFLHPLLLTHINSAS